MIKNIKLNLQEIESMLYFWQACRDKERVSEEYLHQVASMPGISKSYDDEFNAESVRRVLSAITNRELLSDKTKKEARFWNNNMWMMEDLGYTDLMVKPLKRLNLDSLVYDLKDYDTQYVELEVIFSPLHFDEYIIDKNRLIINFFKVMPDMEGNEAKIEGREVKEYIKEKLVELLNITH